MTTSNPDTVPAPPPEDVFLETAEGEGPEPELKGPLRRCIVTRESLPKEAMIRFVLGPDRQVVPDLAGRLPGRGMWLSARADVLERGLTKGAFSRAARGQVQLPPDLRARIETGLKVRIRDQVGLARRAGQAVSGFQQVREWLKAGRAAALVEASDGSPAERARLMGSRKAPLIDVLTAKELGAVFGRDHAVHVAIAPGRIADMLVQEAGRLAAVSGIANGAGT